MYTCNRLKFMDVYLIFRPKHVAWIGLESIIVNGEYIWFWEKKGLSSQYFDWARGEPRNGNDRFCAVYLENSSKWQSARCSIPHNFICKRCERLTKTFCLYLSLKYICTFRICSGGRLHSKPVRRP